MNASGRDLWQDEGGLILSAELIIIVTIAVLGLVVGLANLQQALLGEFADLSLAFQSLNQSYGTPSYRGCWKWFGRTSWTAGSSFVDVFDGCVGSGPGYNGGEIVGGSSYYLPSQGVQAINSTQGTTEAVIVPNAVCPPASQPTPMAAPVVVPPAAGPCSTCP